MPLFRSPVCIFLERVDPGRIMLELEVLPGLVPACRACAAGEVGALTPEQFQPLLVATALLKTRSSPTPQLGLQLPEQCGHGRGRDLGHAGSVDCRAQPAERRLIATDDRQP